MKGKWLLVTLALVGAAAGYEATRATAESNEIQRVKAQMINETRARGLVEEMKHTDLAKMAPLAVKPLLLPEPGIDVMRARLEETYDVAGIGRDTIELKGWIAVKHDHTRPAEGEQVLTWNNAITDTEFVAMELHGDSPIFGPVEITLDKTTPSVGQVGKICFPFAVATTLDAMYMPYRKLFEIDRRAANQIQGPSILPAAKKQLSAKSTSTLATDAKARPVVATIDGLIKAISAKDPKAMTSFYAPAGNNLFFGQTEKGVARGREEYVQELSKTLDNIKTVEIQRNDDLQVRMSGNLAIASLTGVNHVVNTQGQSGSSPWRWTVELERSPNGQWLITHDHLSFDADPNLPIDSQEMSLAVRGKCCLANLSVAVNMSRLDLHMRTATPVHWYSEVETIPPVGNTASVSAIPTPLVANGRQVGTLEHGAVKFREVVRHIPLVDVTRRDLRIASIRIPAGSGR